MRRLAQLLIVAGIVAVLLSVTFLSDPRPLGWLMVSGAVVGLIGAAILADHPKPPLVQRGGYVFPPSERD